MRILIIANARYKGGLSGSDAIYTNFKKHWEGEIYVQEMFKIDFKPFILCYLFRILAGCIIALADFKHYDFIYSASDFLPDVAPAFIYKKVKNRRWLAGFYLFAFKENKIHFNLQRIVKRIIDKFADMVIVTNETMFSRFKDKKKTWINGGVDLALAGISDEKKRYDAVFCGRIHPTKGINELIDIWARVTAAKPKARLAIIGDGDMGLNYIRNRIFLKNLNITLLGYMGEERYEIYKESKIVLYPTPKKYDHFSMSPVEAMACGCPLVCFDNPVMRAINPEGCLFSKDVQDFADNILTLLDNEVLYSKLKYFSCCWSDQYSYKTQSLRVFKEIERQLC